MRTTHKKHWSNKLNKLSACDEAVEWAKTQESPAIAWENCQRGDWMLWLLGILCQSTDQRRQIVFTACQCARLALRFVPTGENRPLLAIEAAEAWVKNPAEVAAWAAGAAAWAAEAAGAAAWAAGAAAWAAEAAGAAAWAAAWAAGAAAWAAEAARAAEHKKCADIVRGHFPKAPKL